MRVRFLVSIAANNWSYAPRQVVDVGGDAYTPTSIPDAIAQAWLTCGHVEAVKPVPETATLARGRK